MKINLKTYAKINLFLDILAILDNGYHSLFMLMQGIDLYDELTVEYIEKGIEITCTNSSLPCDSSNICYKAAQKFFESCGIKNGCRIHLNKRIPLAAGLAGGSSNAAGVIYALNKIYKKNLSREDLTCIALKVGADVPFCLFGGTKIAINMGDVLADIPPINNCFIVLAKPDIGVSTALAYKAFDECEYVRHPDSTKLLYYAAAGDFNGICDAAGNVFEQFIEVGERVEIKSIMRKNNAKLALMSGSGPTVYGVFNNKKDAEACMTELKSVVNDVFICEPVSVGIEEIMSE